MLINKKFKKHPYRLYALELVFFAGYLLDLSQLLLELNAKPVFISIVNFFCILVNVDQDNEIVHLQVGRLVLYCNDFVQYLCLQLFLLLNLILSMDIYYLMVNPFKPARMR